MLKSGIRSEAEEQAALFQWAAYVPELRFMYAVPNGGSRHPREAANLKRQGVKAGVSDIALMRPNKRYYGLFIELKVGKNKPTESQIDFLEYENSQGYCGVVCYGYEEAKVVIEKYLNNEDLEQKRKELSKWRRKTG